jgi:hypothetical protein
MGVPLEAYLNKAPRMYLFVYDQSSRSCEYSKAEVPSAARFEENSSPASEENQYIYPARMECEVAKVQG